MEIETVADLADAIADLIGVYGACKSKHPECCDHKEGQEREDKLCCRVRFVGDMETRIRNAVGNDAHLVLEWPKHKK